MSEKMYCFIPESQKIIAVYDTGTIYDFDSSEEIKGITPNLIFRHCIDINDKAKIFYIDTQKIPGSIDEVNYFTHKTVTAIKSLFNVNEIHDYKLYMGDDEENARIEFTLFFDKDGNWIPISKLYEKNKFNTILGHRYVYAFYKRYSN